MADSLHTEALNIEYFYIIKRIPKFMQAGSSASHSNYPSVTDE